MMLLVTSTSLTANPPLICVSRLFPNHQLQESIVPLQSQPEITIFCDMRTLAEIETAASTLSSSEKAELLLFVAKQLRAERAPLPEPRLFTPEQLQGWMDEDEADMRNYRAGA
jgi:hypothetical protein